MMYNNKGREGTVKGKLAARVTKHVETDQKFGYMNNVHQP